MYEINSRYNFNKIGYAAALSPYNAVWENLRARINNPTDLKLAFAKEMILPQLINLYRKWTAAYNLLMRSDMTFEIVDQPGDDMLSGKNKRGGYTLFEYPDKAVIYINANDDLNSFYLRRAVYHELMHAISHLAVKDKNLKIQSISSAYDETIKPLYRQYAERQKIAQVELKAKIKYYDKKYEYEAEYETAELYEDISTAYEKVFAKYNLWALFQLPFPDEAIAKNGINKTSSVSRRDDEFLACGLSLYFGDNEERERLKIQEPKLYEFIEKHVIPAVN